MPLARLAARRSIRCSPPEQGSSPVSSALIAEGQSMLAISVSLMMLAPGDDEAGEAAAVQQGAVTDDQFGGCFEVVEAVGVSA